MNQKQINVFYTNSYLQYLNVFNLMGEDIKRNHVWLHNDRRCCFDGGQRLNDTQIQFLGVLYYSCTTKKLMLNSGAG